MPFFLFSVKGYKSSDDSGNCAHREGAAEDPQENPHWCEKGRGIERVCVCPSGLVGYNRPEISRQQQHTLTNKTPKKLIVLEKISIKWRHWVKGCDTGLNILEFMTWLKLLGFSLRWKHDSHGVVHDTLSKQQSIEVPVCVELVEDGQHCHCTHKHTHTHTRKALHSVSVPTRVQHHRVSCSTSYPGLWQRWRHRRKGSRCSRTCPSAVQPPPSVWPRRTSGS